MNEFSIDIAKMQNIAAAMEKQEKALEKAEDVVETIENTLQLEGEAKAKLRVSMRKICRDLMVEKESCKKLRTTLFQASEVYGMTEKGLKERVQICRLVAGALKDVITTNMVYAAPTLENFISASELAAFLVNEE